MKKYFGFVFIGFLAAFFWINISSAEASMTRTEINEQLGSVAFVLSGLSRDLQTGRISTVSAYNELKKLSELVSFLSAMIQPSTNLATGQVSGAFSGIPSDLLVSNSFSTEAIVLVEPVSGSKILFAGGMNRDVLGIRIKPVLSDIEVQRFDVTFSDRVVNYVEEISLVSNKVLAVKGDLKQEDFTRNGNEYTLRFEGFSDLVREDQSRTFYVRMKIKERIPISTGFPVKVFIPRNGLRAVDQAGIHHLFPNNNAGKDGIFSSQFTIFE